MTSTTAAVMKSRLAPLDGLRGLAALAVVVAHYLSRGPTLYPELGDAYPWLEYGGRGVELFFIISGFVIVRSVSRGSINRFALSRFIRLYPLYWICVAITYSLVLVFGLPGREVRFPELFVNVTMLQSFIGVPDVDGAYWTLAVELAFYVVVAVLWFSGLLSRFRNPCLLVWLAIGLAVHAASDLSIQFMDRVPGINTIGWMPWFICGIALSFIHSGSRDWILFLIPVLTVVVIGALDLVDGLILAAMLVLVCTVLFIHPLGLDRQAMVWLGSISYALYLLHQNIGYVLLRAASAAGVNRALALSAAFASVVLLAWIVTAYLDMPIRRLLSRRLLR